MVYANFNCFLYLEHFFSLRLSSSFILNFYAKLQENNYLEITCLKTTEDELSLIEIYFSLETILLFFMTRLPWKETYIISSINFCLTPIYIFNLLFWNKSINDPLFVQDVFALCINQYFQKTIYCLMFQTNSIWIPFWCLFVISKWSTVCARCFCLAH